MSALDSDLAETDALIDKQNEYFALMLLQGAIRNFFGKPFALDEYRAILILERAQRDVMSAAVSKHVNAVLHIEVAA